MKKKLIVIASSLELAAILANLPTLMSIKKGPYKIYFYNQKNALIIGSGMGIASAAMATQYALASFAISEVINLGIGGSLDPKLNLGELIMAESETYLHIGANFRADFENLALSFGLEPVGYSNKIIGTFKLKEQNLPFKRAHFGTSDLVSANQDDLNFIKCYYPNVSLENMEGAAIAHVCQLYNLDFLEIRAISNYAGERNKDNWNIKLALNSLKEAINYV